MKKPRIYMDYNATAPLLPQAREAMEEALALPGNPSSVHAEGRAARAVMDKARRQVAALAGASAACVTFTSGATEAAATVLTPHYKMGKADLAVSHLYVPAVEHPCILAGGRFGPEQITKLAVDSQGLVDLVALKTRLEDHDAASGLALVAIQLANNETGVLQPVAEAAAIIKEHGGILVVDAVQAGGRLAVDISALGADFLLLSSHKIGGPKGIGAVVSAGEIMMPVPLIPGGGQERGHRSGTESPAAAAGFGAAAEQALNDLEANARKIAADRDRLEAGIRQMAPDCIIHAGESPRLINTTFFSLPGLKAETAQIAFDLEGIAVSAGSACSSGKVGPSHVLAAMGKDADLGGIRVSIGLETSDAELTEFLRVFGKINEKRDKNRKEKTALV
ncbi:cysteine desulfurase family protein [Hoeflea prorocentri]|uniref:Cysteine desulfurase n=1 Tax=Hoeflea prorocentri TaxID=1922333 RepID=A0A9X3UKL6_9HYPH|nr:cysteine desulfurase family protein [Hoeflea prorocentri]MCY6380631.1 cysteine desulfurase family protein [Hoeflea prorocentri]MDA5398431.1 cysteine desulfurase family protein [Hoeflea prorocentri]